VRERRKRAEFAWASRLAGGLGFEPRFSESESDVLPLNYPPPRGRSCYSKLGSLCKLQEGIDGSTNFRAPGRARETFPPRAGALPGRRRGKIILPGPEGHELRRLRHDRSRTRLRVMLIATVRIASGPRWPRGNRTVAPWSNRLAESDRRDDGSDVEIRRDAAPDHRRRAICARDFLRAHVQLRFIFTERPAGGVVRGR
jgi:hypothetical protein